MKKCSVLSKDGLDGILALLVFLGPALDKPVKPKKRDILEAEVRHSGRQ